MNEQADKDHKLKSELIAAIRTTGPLSFNSFMEAALYHPQWGYYSRTKSQPGRRGDFFTSVSVGACFGELLALHLANTWTDWDRPAALEIIEQGANSGQLACDYLEALSRDAPETYTACHVHLIEQSPSLRAEQPEHLRPHETRVSHWASLETLPSPSNTPRYFLANELLDAFPIHLVQWVNGHWHELFVEADPQDEFKFFRKPISSEHPLFTELERIDTTDFEDGYTTEINLAIHDWLHALRRVLRPGDRALIIDYALPETDYFAPHRKRGTLRCYDGHRCHENVLLQPGHQDITAHVNLTRLIQAAEALGFTVRQSTDQHHFLTQLARPLLLQHERELTGPPTREFQQWVRQFQQLTHPGLMGRTFHCLELELTESKTA